MDRAQKQEQIEFLKGLFGGFESLVLTSVEGLDAGQISDLRRRLHEKDVSFRVIKNKLAKIASAGTNISQLNDAFVGSTAIAWSESDAVTPAKVLVDFQKDVESFQIKTGFASGKRLEIEELKALAKLPSLDELRAQILGLLQAVPSRLLAQISAPAGHLVGVLQAKVDKEKEAA